MQQQSRGHARPPPRSYMIWSQPSSLVTPNVCGSRHFSPQSRSDPNLTLAPATTHETRERERSRDDVELAAGADIKHEWRSWRERGGARWFRGIGAVWVSLGRLLFGVASTHSHTYLHILNTWSLIQVHQMQLHAVTSWYLQKWRTSPE